MIIEDIGELHKLFFFFMLMNEKVKSAADLFRVRLFHRHFISMLGRTNTTESISCFVSIIFFSQLRKAIFIFINNSNLITCPALD